MWPTSCFKQTSFLPFQKTLFFSLHGQLAKVGMTYTSITLSINIWDKTNQSTKQPTNLPTNHPTNQPTIQPTSQSCLNWLSVTRCEQGVCNGLDPDASCSDLGANPFYECSCSDDLMYYGPECDQCNVEAGYLDAPVDGLCVCDEGRGYTQQDGVCSEYLSSPGFIAPNSRFS